MLHYLIMIFEKNYPDTLQIQQDLNSVPEAAKVKWGHKFSLWGNFRHLCYSWEEHALSSRSCACSLNYCISKYFIANSCYLGKLYGWLTNSLGFFLPFTSLAELEKEVHSIKNGLKALEAVSCCICVTFPPLGSSPVCNYVFEHGRDGRQGEVFKCQQCSTPTWNGRCHICGHTQKRGLMCKHTWKHIHILHFTEIYHPPTPATKIIAIHRMFFPWREGNITDHFLSLSLFLPPL